MTDDLIARVEAGDVSRELDAEIWLATTKGATRRKSTVTSTKGLWPPYVIDETREASGLLVTVPSYTTSLDAAYALKEAVLPGWVLDDLGESATRWSADLGGPGPFQTAHATAPTHAAALVAAVLRAWEGMR